MSKARRVAFVCCALLLCLAVLSVCCSAPAPVPTVGGAETPTLISRVRGYLITQDRLDSGDLSTIRVVALPSMTEHVITPTMTYGQFTIVESISGPDHAGRIAFVQNTPSKDEVNLVKLINLDGTGERELTRVDSQAAGSVSHHWLEPGISQELALSPVGGRLAFIRNLRGVRMRRHYTMGTLEIWDVDRGVRIRSEHGAVDDELSWFPDGRRVAYTALLPGQRAPMPPENKTFGAITRTEFDDGSILLPTIVILDVVSGETTVVGLGRRPMVSRDGRIILVQNQRDNLHDYLWAIDVATGRYSKVDLPGLLGPVMAYLPDGLVIYQSRPTQGEPVRRSWAGSFRAGIQMLPIKVCDLSTGHFQTLIEAVDPRHDVSFGSSE